LLFFTTAANRMPFKKNAFPSLDDEESPLSNHSSVENISLLNAWLRSLLLIVTAEKNAGTG